MLIFINESKFTINKPIKSWYDVKQSKSITINDVISLVVFQVLNLHQIWIETHLLLLLLIRMVDIFIALEDLWLMEFYCIAINVRAASKYNKICTFWLSPHSTYYQSFAGYRTKWEVLSKKKKCLSLQPLPDQFFLSATFLRYFHERCPTEVDSLVSSIQEFQVRNRISYSTSLTNFILKQYITSSSLTDRQLESRNI